MTPAPRVMTLEEYQRRALIHDKCKCCHGSGTQRNRNTGLVQICPCCHGTGKGKKTNAFDTIPRFP
jgi:ATP:corrinoid adenosyltransferase